MNSTILQTESSKTKAIVINALFIAMTFVATMFINVRLPLMGNGGLIHMGNVPLFLAALVYGKKTGAIAGAFGMGLFDIVSGWAIWSPFTFVIVGAMGFVVGLISEKAKGNRVLVITLAIATALIIKVVGYYFAEVILYGNWVQPFGSIPGNIMQVVLAGIIVIPIAARLKKRA
ncbi:ECF transporter S component [Neobacillus cucumis]|uniref:ECF transporter S component n=1 Tax=Neobacillus cucumis TaxID=1740721 RepID=UPI0018DFA152|nr:ECF transporter S component [Neobacillus cucumis]MBI0580272.1 ECF transporter S component [Neobacillus cucumis]WHY92936.1 ECF transporter S component [Neobacillus cucumis]